MSGCVRKIKKKKINIPVDIATRKNSVVQSGRQDMVFFYAFSFFGIFLFEVFYLQRDVC